MRTSDAGTRVALPADYTFIASDNDVHTFVDGVTLVPPGDRRLAAVEALSGSITGISQPMAVRRPIFHRWRGRPSHRSRRPDEADRASRSRASRNAWKGRRDMHPHPALLGM